MRLYLGLIHFPVYNKNLETIASAVTTLDIHDISRLARTYGAKQLLVVTPLTDQRELVQRIKRHWTQGYGASYNPDRKEAIELVQVAHSIDKARQYIKQNEGEDPICIATDASGSVGRLMAFDEARVLVRGGSPVFIYFGTAWGLHRGVLEEADYVLEPVYGPTDYNHLSVRAAAAIIIDRLVRA
ncbi:MAG: RNA methyltransferase [Deltaproteobacteria bacterium]|nr:MAG: RNA methyltransferase [Deltaproteobacteria bacterium]